MENRLTRSSGSRPQARVVHLGLGAFFRAHCAVYFAEADQAWGVIGVSLRSPAIRDKLKPQGFAYTAAELSPEGTKTQQIEIVRDVLVAPEDPTAVLEAIADPAIEIVSLTVTEKGYCHDPATGALNLSHPDIIHDIAEPLPRSAPGFIVRALDMRRSAGLPAFSVMSCDNLADNGALIARVVIALADQINPDLAAWITANGCFPSTMVDRIVPATTPDDITALTTQTGVYDAAPVMHEPFRQWVIEDQFVGHRPPVAAQFVDAIAPFENMKLRMLNGTHSAIAYIGYLTGHKTVSAAVADPVLADFIRGLWQHEIIPTLTPPPGVVLSDYADALFARYANPAIQHSTWQIAMDGSQKLPQRILATINAAQNPTPGLLLTVAAWMQYVGGTAEDGSKIDVQDPLAAQLAALAQTSDPVSALLGIDDIFDSTLRDRIAAPLGQTYQTMRDVGLRAAMADIVDASSA